MSFHTLNKSYILSNSIFGGRPLRSPAKAFLVQREVASPQTKTEGLPRVDVGIDPYDQCFRTYCRAGVYSRHSVGATLAVAPTFSVYITPLVISSGLFA